MKSQIKSPGRAAARTSDRVAPALPARNRDWRSLALRLLAVAGQAMTLGITWPLWIVRHYPPQPPMLPAFGLPTDGFPQFNVLPWLWASLVLVLLFARWGVVVHIGLLVAAMLLDQTRMQPQCISLALLMVASLGTPGAKLVGRSHLIAMWFFAGVHKLLSPGYFHKVVPYLATGLLGKTDSRSLAVLGAAAAGLEVALALLAIVPRSRQAAAALACAMHSTIALWLALRLGWNAGVWPWNIVLAAAALLLIWPWRTSPLRDWRESSRLAKTAALVILISPVGYYFGVVDAYLAYCLYSGNTLEAKIVLPDGAEVRLDTLASSLNAAMPPAVRLYEEYFEQVGEPGELLVIHDARWWSRIHGKENREIYKPAPAIGKEAGGG